MSVNSVFAPVSVPLPASSAAGSARRDAALGRFAVLLPVVMAVFLLLVAVLGKAAQAPFLLVFVPLIVWSAFADTEKALYVLCAWCWMDGTIRGVFGGATALVLGRDIILLLVLIGWGVRRLRTRAQTPLRMPPGTLLVALFVLNCLIQTANPASFGLLSNLAGLKTHLTPIPLLFLGYDVFRRRAQVRSFYLFLTLATCVIAVVSIIQYMQGPGWTYAHFPGTSAVISQNVGDPMQTSHDRNLAFKPPGTTTFGGGANAFIGIALPPAFVLLLLPAGRFQAVGKAALVGVLFIFLIALFLNGVRSGLVTGAAGVIACGVFAGGRQTARTLGVAALCLILGLGAWTFSQGLSGGHVASRYGSTFANPVDALHQDRETFFEQAADLAARVPLGNGLGKTGPGAGQFGADPAGDFANPLFSEAYLGCMILETGLLGAFLIALIGVFYLGRGWQLLRRTADSEGRLLAAGLLAILVVLFANFFATPILFQPPGSLLFWLAAAALLRVAGSARRAETAP